MKTKQSNDSVVSAENETSHGGYARLADRSISTDWQDYFELPFELQFGKVFSKGFNMAFDFIPAFISNVNAFRISKDDKEKLVRIINGSDEKIKTTLNYDYRNGTIFVDEMEFIWIRSWGRLTGKGGGLGLEPEVAAEIQNNFANYILGRLRAASPTVC